MIVKDVLRNAWLVLLVSNLALTVALLVTTQLTPLYESDGTYVIGPAADLTSPETIVRSFDSLQGQGIVPTLVELLSSDTIAERVASPLGVDADELEQYEIRANVLSSSNTLQLTVLGPDATVTTGLARGVGAEASRLFERLYSVYQIEPLDVPSVPDEPVSPSLIRNGVLALLLGLTLGVGLALLRERHRRTGSLLDEIPAGEPRRGVEQQEKTTARAPSRARGTGSRRAIVAGKRHPRR